MDTFRDPEFTVRTLATEELPPDPKGTAQALQRVGYSLEEALADLIDNSIDAEATRVLVRFFRDAKSFRKVAIVDNGHGMVEATLHKAMQFGVQADHRQGDLGKYGIGLKTASFSQCHTLGVFSNHKGTVSGRRWSFARMQDNWRCEILDPRASAELFKIKWGELDLSRQGTIVLWDDLDDLGAGVELEKLIRKISKRLPVELGLRFHRFIQSRELSIQCDVYNFSSREVVPVNVPPLDPFGYKGTGNGAYPITFNVTLPNRGSLKMAAHIWPPKSEQAEYKLGGGRVAERQGFYFYRNDRLIQGGGWNKVRESDSEPHSSHARVAIDLPASLDSVFGLTIQKSKVVPPADFRSAVLSARCGKTSFDDYIAAAVENYRAGSEEDEEDVIVPGDGLPFGLQRKVASLLESGDDGAKEIEFKWMKLDPKLFFVSSPSRSAVYLNVLYRPVLVDKGARSSSDIPVIKLLLFLMLSPDLRRARSSKKRDDWHARCNAVLVAALKSLQ